MTFQNNGLSGWDSVLSVDASFLEERSVLFLIPKDGRGGGIGERYCEMYHNSKDVESKASALLQWFLSSQGIRGCISVMTALKFTYLFIKE